MDTPGLSCARLHALFLCTLPSGRRLDLALVNNFKTSKWKPKTFWDGCLVYSEEKKATFLSLEYVIRGALLSPTHIQDPSLHYFVDTVDADMFLRALNATKTVCI